METKVKICGLLASDSTNWLVDAATKIKKYDAGIAWNSKRPTGTDATLTDLREILNLGGTFKIYYSQKNIVKFAAEVIDMAESSKQYLEKKETWLNIYPKIWDYKDSFDEYKDDTKEAKIVFLIKSLQTISIDIDEFIIYGDYKRPTQDNMQPITNSPLDRVGVAQM
jgi:hypothetical protein